MSILPTIKGHDELVQLNHEEQQLLCEEIRNFLVSNVAKTGGHLASNLGIVELAVAIETVFNTATDRLVFDVGHQSYVHKLLTGRQADFSHLRQFGGISGFPKPHESQTDAFVAGHASSSVSIALGMARARTLLNQDYHVVALLGDGAATGGMIYEGLNDAAVSREPMVVILNDNEMSIHPNVGGMSRHLSLLRTKEQYMGAKRRYRVAMERIPGGEAVYDFTRRVKNRVKRMVLPTTIFENMGMNYLGPVDGHDLPGLISLLRTARDLREPVVVHVVTQKGRGYVPAESEPARFHGIGKFDPETGKTLSASKTTFSDAFGSCMMELAAKDPKVCSITAAMPSGTGLDRFMAAYPKRCFDVGIAEEHAVSMAGGLAKQGMTPVVAIYSTFLQRGFDQIIQDVALEKLHVVFAVDRAGLVGEDGPTHHGVFDIGFLRQIPGMTILCPWSLQELKDMLCWAVNEHNGPVAIRYPRGGEGTWSKEMTGFQGDPDAFAVYQTGEDVTVITYGVFTNQVMEAAQKLKAQGIGVKVIRLLSASHISAAQLADAIVGEHVFVAEESICGSGLKEAIAWELNSLGVNCQIHGLDLGKAFTPHGDIASLYASAGIDADSIVKFIREVHSNEK